MTDFWTRLTNGPCYIIAEAGINHDGSLMKAQALIDAAKNAGADAVKFQLYRADELTLPGPHRDMLATLQIGVDEMKWLKSYADSKGIDFLCSPFDIESAKALKDMGVKALKIGSGEFTNLPFLHAARDMGIPLIISTGMCTQEEWEDVSQDARWGDVAWLHCVSAYPSPIAGYNLKCMEVMRDTYEYPEVVGLSDHTIGDTLPIAAVAMGAKILEKHITLCFEDEGPDHAASMEPGEFALMVQKIRQVESAMGDGVKRPTPEEMKTMKYARRVQTAEGFKRAP